MATAHNGLPARGMVFEAIKQIKQEVLSDLQSINSKP
jgi:hypothetical protein